MQETTVACARGLLVWRGRLARERGGISHGAAESL